MEIYLEHVRSFSKKHRVPLRPLTLLVGENSSGKSTFLAVVSSILDAARFPASPGFNEPPYNLGTFDTIATYKGGKYGRDKTFSIGFSEGRKGDEEYREVIATYGSDYGNVVLTHVRATSSLGRLNLDITKLKLAGTLSLSNGDAEPIQLDFTRELHEPALVAHAPFFQYVMQAILEELQKNRREGRLTETHNLVMLTLEVLPPPYPSCFSFAPIRSKPHRTYDEFSEDYSPEGDHVPTLMARLLRQEPTSADSQRLQQALVRFGKESGLFKKIDVKRLGKKVSDPFQLQVAIGGPSVNLADVGYGVSQVLPIVVQTVLKTRSKVLLLQQPEVHLHPRAQAALGSFFVDRVAHDDRMFLVETHSDYFVDRIRQEVACGNLSHEKVLILFFHKPELDTSVWPITIDAQGNVENAPAEYRGFFLEEQLSLLSRTSE